jgi:hypothetical protein
MGTPRVIRTVTFDCGKNGCSHNISLPLADGVNVDPADPKFAASFRDAAKKNGWGMVVLTSATGEKTSTNVCKACFSRFNNLLNELTPEEKDAKLAKKAERAAKITPEQKAARDAKMAEKLASKLAELKKNSAPSKK